MSMRGFCTCTTRIDFRRSAASTAPAIPPDPIASDGRGARIASATAASGLGQNRALIHFHGAVGLSSRKSAEIPAASARPNAWERNPAMPSLIIQGAVMSDISGLFGALPPDVNATARAQRLMPAALDPETAASQRRDLACILVGPQSGRSEWLAISSVMAPRHRIPNGPAKLVLP